MNGEITLFAAPIVGTVEFGSIPVPGPQGPKGEKGDPGEQGPQGPKGDKGDPGEQGPQGIQGPPGVGEGTAGEKGDKGDPGEQGPQGVQGPEGPKGDKGDPGEVGPQGPQGIQGIQGPKGEKGDPGDGSASQGPQGDPGPKGDKGDTGEQGPQGIQGEQGVPGPEGPRGPQGEPGITGADGPMGPMGPEGPQGPQGMQGPQGTPGTDGAQGPKGDKGDPGEVGPQGIQGIQGPKGDKGDKGDRGDPGPQGIQGIQGPQGEQGPPGVGEATQGEIGPQGPQGEQGIQGPQGDPGPKGDKGDKGDPGEQGPEGPQGIQGVPGSKGDQGSEGPRGPQGDPGPTGEQGPQGIQGVPGDPGPKGEKGDQGPKGDKGDPGEQGPQGIQGVQGIQGIGGYSGKSPYVNTTTQTWYVYDDESRIFINSGISALGLKGDQGDVGPQGVQGIQGPKGDKGDTGEQGPQGLQGPQGIQGPKGDSGEPGLKGDKGDTGDTGITPTITPTVQEVEYGESPMITVYDDDDEFFTWAFSIPKGAPGPQGIQGIPGPKGEPGAGIDIRAFDTAGQFTTPTTIPSTYHVFAQYDNIGSSVLFSETFLCTCYMVTNGPYELAASFLVCVGGSFTTTYTFCDVRPLTPLPNGIDVMVAFTERRITGEPGRIQLLISGPSSYLVYAKSLRYQESVADRCARTVFGGVLGASTALKTYPENMTIIRGSNRSIVEFAKNATKWQLIGEYQKHYYTTYQTGSFEDTIEIVPTTLSVEVGYANAFTISVGGYFTTATSTGEIRCLSPMPEFLELKAVIHGNPAKLQIYARPRNPLTMVLRIGAYIKTSRDADITTPVIRNFPGTVGATFGVDTIPDGIEVPIVPFDTGESLIVDVLFPVNTWIENGDYWVSMGVPQSDGIIAEGYYYNAAIDPEFAVLAANAGLLWQDIVQDGRVPLRALNKPEGDIIVRYARVKGGVANG